MEIKELDTVVLTRDFPEHGLRKGDVGAVVHGYGEGGDAFEVEFVAADGTTLALLTLRSEDIGPLSGIRKAILHVRTLVSA